MIGVFDSGSGGLTVLRELKRIAPDIDVVYLGDFKNLPYGEKSPEELGALTVLAVERLLQEGAKNIVSACNSVSGSVAQPIIDLLGRSTFGLVEMVGPTVRALTPLAKEGAKILLVATEATIRSGVYSRAFSVSDISICSVAIPALVPAIESGASKSTTKSIIKDALKDEEDFDVLILGCTQYPLVQDSFQVVASEMNAGVEIFNPSEAVASEAVRRFGSDGEGSLRFLLSAPAPLFEERVHREFGRFSPTLEVIQPLPFIRQRHDSPGVASRAVL